jgi:hypothetical protein
VNAPFDEGTALVTRVAIGNEPAQTPTSVRTSGNPLMPTPGRR